MIVLVSNILSLPSMETTQNISVGDCVRIKGHNGKARIHPSNEWQVMAFNSAFALVRNIDDQKAAEKLGRNVAPISVDLSMVESFRP